MKATSNIPAESLIATPSETINTTGYSNFCSDTIDPTRRIDVTLYNTIVAKTAIPNGAVIRISTICLCEN